MREKRKRKETEIPGMEATGSKLSLQEFEKKPHKFPVENEERKRRRKQHSPSPLMAEAAEHCRNTTPHCKARRTCRRLGTGTGAAAAQRRPLMSKPKRRH